MRTWITSIGPSELSAIALILLNLCMWILNVMLDSFDGLVKVVLWIVNYLRVGKAGDPALQGR